MTAVYAANVKAICWSRDMKTMENNDPWEEVEQILDRLQTIALVMKQEHEKTLQIIKMMDGENEQQQRECA